MSVILPNFWCLLDVGLWKKNPINSIITWYMLKIISNIINSNNFNYFGASLFGQHEHKCIFLEWKQALTLTSVEPLCHALIWGVCHSPRTCSMSWHCDCDWIVRINQSIINRPDIIQLQSIHIITFISSHWFRDRYKSCPEFEWDPND